MDTAYAEAFTASTSNEQAGLTDSTSGYGFLNYYALSRDKSLEIHRWSRGEILQQARKAAHMLAHSFGVQPGDHVCHWFTSNTVEDIVLRLASVMLRSVPVTVNWSTDTPATVAFKVCNTKCKLLVFDEGVDDEKVAEVKGMCEELEHTCKATRLCLGKRKGEPGQETGEIEIRPMELASERIVIFTSGTTSMPKGVKLSYKNYVTNRATFEQFVDVKDKDFLCTVIVNPLHHTNSTSISDWAIRRPRACIHLFQKYTTAYWKQLLQIVEGLGTASVDGSSNESRTTRIVAPLVARHFEYLENVVQEGKLHLSRERLQAGLSKVDFLVGSAPVGPQTVERIKGLTTKLPLVRFGSTETCLQVVGTPKVFPEEVRLAAFQKGWAHTYKGEPSPGYYIGQEHPGFTQVKVVRSKTRGDPEYFVECGEGEPGLLVVQGGNVMLGYIDDEKTKEVIHVDESTAEKWYSNLGDVCFWLSSPKNGGRDIYWQSRDNALLIRGGVNYSYAQINQALVDFAANAFSLDPSDIAIAVIGEKLSSEHDDDCLARIEISSTVPQGKQATIEGQFLQAVQASSIPKGYKPSRVSFGTIPRNFKGAVLVADLKELWKDLVA